MAESPSPDLLKQLLGSSKDLFLAIGSAFVASGAVLVGVWRGLRGQKLSCPEDSRLDKVLSAIHELEEKMDHRMSSLEKRQVLMYGQISALEERTRKM